MPDDFPLDKEWLPSQVEFICQHLDIDMSAQQLGALFAAAPQEICRVALVATGRTPGWYRLDGRFFQIAAKVRKATWHDGYEPMSLAEFHRIYPNGCRV